MIDPSSESPWLIVLGTAQDAGVPQAGCLKACCDWARSDPSRRRLPACLGIVDPRNRKRWIIDCTPSFPEQLALLDRHSDPDWGLAGIFLTHAHMGHYTGLIHLGREAMDIRDITLWCSSKMRAFLRANAPWAGLLNDGNVTPREIIDGEPFALSKGVSVLPYQVPHRAEFTDTYAFLFSGDRQRLFYFPDIDSWDGLTFDIDNILKAGDTVLLDGSFFSEEELPHRDMALIPHPLVTDTVGRYANKPYDLVLIHLNHTNPIWRASPQQEWIMSQGAVVGERGQAWMLA